MAEVAGQNARELRLSAKVKLEDFARAMQSYGVPWTTGRVGDFESGRAAPNLATLFTVAAALGDILTRPVGLADLFAGDGDVRINDKLSVDLSVLRAAVSGEGVRPEPVAEFVADDSLPALGFISDSRASRAAAEMVNSLRLPYGVDPVRHAQVMMAFSESDARMCKNIGIDPSTGAAAMAKLWGRTFRQERDHRAGPDANAQRRGQISRQLKAELLSVTGKEIE